MKHHLDSTIKPLKGKTLCSILRQGDASVVLGFRDGTQVLLEVAGDCCSYSAFYGVDPGTALEGDLLDISEGSYPADALSVTSADDEDTALSRCKDEGITGFESPEHLSIWNVVIKTTTGTALIRHINNSNGYYDGYTSYTFLP